MKHININTTCTTEILELVSNGLMDGPSPSIIPKDYIERYIDNNKHKELIDREAFITLPMAIDEEYDIVVISMESNDMELTYADRRLISQTCKVYSSRIIVLQFTYRPTTCQTLSLSRNQDMSRPISEFEEKAKKCKKHLKLIEDLNSLGFKFSKDLSNIEDENCITAIYDNYIARDIIPEEYFNQSVASVLIVEYI